MYVQKCILFSSRIQCVKLRVSMSKNSGKTIITITYYDESLLDSSSSSDPGCFSFGDQAGTFSQPLGILHSSRTLHVFHKTSETSPKIWSTASIAQITSRCSNSGSFLLWTTLTCGSRPLSKRLSNLSPSTSWSLPATHSAKGQTCSLYQAVEPFGFLFCWLPGFSGLARSLCWLGVAARGPSVLSSCSSVRDWSFVWRIHLCLAKHSLPSHHRIDSALT